MQTKLNEETNQKMSLLRYVAKMRGHRDALAARLSDLVSVGSQKNLNAKLSHEIVLFSDLSAISNRHAAGHRRNYSSDRRYDADDR